MVIDDKAVAISALTSAVEIIERTLGITPYGVYADVRVRLDILEARINNPNAPAPNVTNPFYVDGYGGVSVSVGDGYPTEDRVNGSLYLRRDGYVYEGLYERRNGVWQLIPTDFWLAGNDLSGGYYSQTVIGLQDRPLASTMPLDGYHVTWNDTDGYWEPQIGFYASRDLSGTKIDQTVIGIQGNPISSETPIDGYVLSYRSGTWYPTRLPVIFDPGYESQNIVANRPTDQSTIDNTKIGIVNLASSNLATGVTGDYATSVGGYRNQITDDYSIIVGGLDNTVSAEHSIIVGGMSNLASAIFSSILGGSFNSVVKQYTTIGGGYSNTADGYYSSILGGYANLVSGNYASILGGNTNLADGYMSVILGGTGNRAQGDSSFVADGYGNQATGNESTVLNGLSNTVSSNYSTIINGTLNNISGANSIILLGSNNTISSQHSVVAGQNNTSSSNSTFINGDSNIVVGNYSCANGYGNTTSAIHSSVFGYAANARIIGQKSHAVNYFTNPGDSQFSRILLDGYQVNGGQFNLTIPGTLTNIEMENGKSYDINIRIIVVNTSGTPTCARFKYNALAHQESGTLVIDILNDDLIDDNGTNWSVTVDTSGAELIIQIDSYGTDDRRASATIEWRELSRL
jgi:hypothetical protein